MAIDYAIDLPCPPKTTLGTGGIIERLKDRDRANVIIRDFRQAGDARPPSEMGFELTRSTLDGGETELLVVQDVLDRAAELQPLAAQCTGCPANVFNRPFGCIGQVNYPISDAAEAWLLDQLPGIETPLVWLLLREGIQKLGYDGETTKPLRPNPQYFEESRLRGRDLAEFVFSTDQVFEMLFLLGHIQPAQAAVLLLFFHAVPRDVEADMIVRILSQSLTGDEIAALFPFILDVSLQDERTIAELKQCFRALHAAWRLGRPLLLDV